MARNFCQLCGADVSAVHCGDCHEALAHGEMIEQFCRDLNQAHDELLRAQAIPQDEWPNYDWPEWTPQANSIRWAEKRLGKPLSKSSMRALAARREAPVDLAPGERRHVCGLSGTGFSCPACEVVDGAWSEQALRALRLVESVYRRNCVVPGEPSSVLAELQRVIALAARRDTEEPKNG